MSFKPILIYWNHFNIDMISREVIIRLTMQKIAYTLLNDFENVDTPRIIRHCHAFFLVPEWLKFEHYNMLTTENVACNRVLPVTIPASTPIVYLMLG